METKALKKQMGAAIAMVLVAAIALAASTYAWFVTNNTVKATTSTISAKSNAAFMTIANGTTGSPTSDVTEVTTQVGTKALYPATFGEEANSTKGKFSTAYAQEVGKTDISANTLKLVGTGKNPTGSYEEATNGDYALLQQYNISSKGQSLKGLSVSEVTANTYAEDGSKLSTALRVLITTSDGNAWESYGLDSASGKYVLKASSADDNSAVKFGDVTAGQATVVNVYLFYEGSDAQVYTNQLSKLTATNAVTVAFTATADPNGTNMSAGSGA